jgi:hypothetical protein
LGDTPVITPDELRTEPSRRRENVSIDNAIDAALKSDSVEKAEEDDKKDVKDEIKSNIDRALSNFE